MKKYALILAILLIPNICQAQWSVQVTLRSYHFDDTEYNEWNLGFGVGYRLEYFDVEIGFYKNSYDRNSFYLVGTKEWPKDKNFGLAGTFGIVTGYDELIRPFTAMGIYLNNNPKLRLGFVPDLESPLIFSQIKYKL